jgi:4-alpha-glucanotransferase
VDEATVLAERATDRDKLWEAFVAAGVAAGAPPAPEDTPRVVDAALDFVARTASPLALLPIEDLLGQEEQPNLPGTIDEHPNWRRRQTRDAATLLDEPRVAARLDRLARARPRL